MQFLAALHDGLECIDEGSLSTLGKVKQAQLRWCKLGPGTVYLIRFFSEIKILSVALLSQASLVVGCMLTSTYDFQAKFQLPT